MLNQFKSVKTKLDCGSNIISRVKELEALAFNEEEYWRNDDSLDKLSDNQWEYDHCMNTDGDDILPEELLSFQEIEPINKFSLICEDMKAIAEKLGYSIDKFYAIKEGKSINEKIIILNGHNFVCDILLSDANGSAQLTKSIIEYQEKRLEKILLKGDYESYVLGEQSGVQKRLMGLRFLKVYENMNNQERLRLFNELCKHRDNILLKIPDKVFNEVGLFNRIISSSKVIEALESVIDGKSEITVYLVIPVGADVGECRKCYVSKTRAINFIDKGTTKSRFLLYKGVLEASDILFCYAGDSLVGYEEFNPRCEIDKVFCLPKSVKDIILLDAFTMKGGISYV